MNFRDLENFFVFGLARSGRAVAALLWEHGYGVTAWDENPDTVADFAQTADGVRVATTADWKVSLEKSDCLIVSPGVPLDHRLVAHARSHAVPVVGEIEAAWHFTEARLVGVTGTNGKSTVVGVIGEILRQGGIDVDVAGNIGRPFAESVREGTHDVVVLELSSFQLDTIDRFHVDVAVLLNVTPDHLDRYHGSFEEYASSKRRILNHSRPHALYVYNADDDVASALAPRYHGPSFGFSSSRELDEGVFERDGAIVRRVGGVEDEVLRRSEFTPVGVHNLENAMASVAAARAFDVALDDIRAALRIYRSLPHRMELVRVIGGVAYVNDSKATNVDATVKSLQSIDGGTIVILGGRDKDGDFSLLVPHVGRVRLAVLIGEAAAVIRRALEGHCELAEADDMTTAVRAAAQRASAGDTVLLAPACASFDMFDNYQERGEAFRKAVNTI
jgi:UDP-N-acetylmuramoylalanine--D-glutamate ligase